MVAMPFKSSRFRRSRVRLRALSNRAVRWMPVWLGIAAIGAIALVYWQSAEPRLSNVTIATGTTDGSYQAFGKVIASTLNDADTSVAMDVVKSAGSKENARLVATSPRYLGLVQSDTQVSPDVTLIARLYPEVFHLLARPGAEINDVSDLVDKRVALMPAGSGSNAAFYQLLKHYQIDEARMEPVPGTLSDGLDALENGAVDALFVVSALGNDAIARAVREAGVRMVGIERAQAMALFDPAITRTEVPKGVYAGENPVPDETIDVLSVDALLVANRDLPDSVAAEIVTALFERRQQMVDANRQAAFMTEPSAQQRLTIGIHPGALSYYERDKPAFLVEYAEPIGVAFSVLVLMASGLWQARTWLANARKNRADRYNLQIAALVDQAERVGTLDELEEVRRNLFAIFHEVITDLDTDRIDEDSLRSFSFVWDVAQSTLSQRQLLVAGQAAPTQPAPTGREHSK